VHRASWQGTRLVFEPESPALKPKGEEMGASISEIALLKIVEKIPQASQKHARTMLFIHGHKNTYFSLKELSQKTLIEQKELERILEELAGKKLLEKEGCLYKKPEKEKIGELL
jgi:beta-N-acetylglucosaminidase